MKVRELLNYLCQCDQELEVLIGSDETVRFVIEHKVVTEPSESFVELS